MMLAQNDEDIFYSDDESSDSESYEVKYEVVLKELMGT